MAKSSLNNNRNMSTLIESYVEAINKQRIKYHERIMNHIKDYASTVFHRYPTVIEISWKQYGPHVGDCCDLIKPYIGEDFDVVLSNGKILSCERVVDKLEFSKYNVLEASKAIWDMYSLLRKIDSTLFDIWGYDAVVTIDRNLQFTVKQYYRYE